MKKKPLIPFIFLFALVLSFSLILSSKISQSRVDVSVDIMNHDSELPELHLSSSYRTEPIPLIPVSAPPGVAPKDQIRFHAYIMRRELDSLTLSMREDFEATRLKKIFIGTLVPNIFYSSLAPD